MQKSELTGSSTVWEGLENGVAYQVRVQAHNRAPEPSSWSAWSATEIPARVPDAAAAPSTERLDPVGSQAQMRVSWGAPANNGHAIAEYRLNVIRGGAVVNTASIAGLGPMPMDPVYAATKAGVILFTQSCAMLNETEKGRVNAVLPGMVDTPIIGKTGDGTTPAKWLEGAIAATKMLAPEDIAAAVVGYIKDDSKAGDTQVVANR